MNIRSFHNRLSLIPRLAIVTLIALAYSTPAFCDEIHDAANIGDLIKVKALLKDNPGLVTGKDDGGLTPLHWAAMECRKDVAELLLVNRAFMS
jgi:ankyrin repeat protein